MDLTERGLLEAREAIIKAVDESPELRYSVDVILTDLAITLRDAARVKMAREIRAVAEGQLTDCGGPDESPCAPGKCWGCDVARILDAALRAQGGER